MWPWFFVLLATDSSASHLHRTTSHRDGKEGVAKGVSLSVSPSVCPQRRVSMRSLGSSQKKAGTDNLTTQAAGSCVLTADIRYAQTLSGRGSNRQSKQIVPGRT